MTLRIKLLLGFGACIAMMLAMGAFALWSAGRLNDHTTDVSGRWLPRIQAASGMQVALLEMRLRQQQYLLATDDDQRSALDKQRAEALAAFKRHREAFGIYLDDPAVHAALEKLDQKLAAYLEVDKNVIQLASMGNASAANDRLRSRATPLLNDLMAQLGDWAEGGTAGARAEAQRAAADFHGLLQWMSLALLLAIAVPAVVAWAITRGVMRQLGGDPRYAFKVVQAIAGGDLGAEVQLARGDTASLLYAMKGMAASLADLVGAVKAAATRIGHAAGEVAAGNLDLSQRTEAQAARLQHTSASMNQMTGTVQQTGTTLRTAHELSASASDTAGRGSAVVQRIVGTMGEISGSARRIADITAVIDGIAFQTNILALNAAVEAARAGDQGRSFAIVAVEVRNLAQRCATAAGQIKALIQESTAKVASGSALAEEAGRTMIDVVGAVGRVNALIGEVDSAAADQTRGMRGIDGDVAELDRTTQQNAALVEQSAAAAASLREQAERLGEAVAVFRMPAAA